MSTEPNQLAISVGRPRPRRWTKSLKRNEQGSVLPIMAALMMMAAAGGALAVDMARAYAAKSDLQLAADSAALAAAIMLPDLEAPEYKITADCPLFRSKMRLLI